MPARGILAVNPSDTALFAKLAGQYQLHRHFLFHSNLYSSSSFFIAGPSVGAPMAAMCLEKLIALGASQIIVYGWCGAISPDLKIGDVFIPTSGVSGEGTSAYYPHASGYEPDTGLTAEVKEFLDENKPCGGPIWTTDAPYREKRTEIETLKKRGVQAVDMEYTGLASVAHFRKAALTAVMMVSDELYRQEWTAKINSKAFRSKSKNMLQSLCDYMDNYFTGDQ